MIIEMVGHFWSMARLLLFFGRSLGCGFCFMKSSHDFSRSEIFWELYSTKNDLKNNFVLDFDANRYVFTNFSGSWHFFAILTNFLRYQFSSHYVFTNFLEFRVFRPFRYFNFDSYHDILTNFSKNRVFCNLTNFPEITIFW